ncbi:MAG: chemotaxis protein CheD [Spirochaetes bacterium]|nr:chemotaxis protein CheD [Spirochaetota bacterium]
MNFRLINVGIADLQVTKAPDILRTVLGSCVSVCLYDPKAKVAGMAHIMLPEQKSEDSNPRKYADSAIPILIEEMENAGAERDRIVAKLAGGSVMFKVAENSLMSEIGKNNIEKSREILSKLGFPIKGEDTGGDFGRTVDFFADNGVLKVKSMNKNERIV